MNLVKNESDKFRGKNSSLIQRESGQSVNISAPIGEVARSAVGEISRRDKKFEFCHSMKSYVLGRYAQPTSHFVRARNDVSCNSEHLLCHSELTRKLVELAKRNFLFLLGVSESNSKQTLKHVLDFDGSTGSSQLSP